MSDAPHDFSPPTPAQVEQHLADHPPTGPSPWARRLPLMVIVAAVVMMLLSRQFTWIVLAWAAIMGLFVALALRAHRARLLEGRTLRIQEMTLLRRHVEALRRAWKLLPQVQVFPLMHARTVTVFAHCLDELGAYESAVVAYSYLVDHMPEQHPGYVLARVQRAVASLQCDHLADADDDLRALRSTAESAAGSPIAAAWRFAQLAQDVRTHHHADAAERADTLVDDLRPLGVEAGYGYALMALCCRTAAQRNPDIDTTRVRELAGRFWDYATTLLPARDLARRFPEVRPFMETA